MTMNNTVLLFTRYGMGSGPQELQLRLISKYLELLGMQSNLPAAICFYTDAVKLVVEGSPVVEQLIALEARGMRLIVCSTCLEHYHLADKVRAGIVGGMGDILEAQIRAEKVLSI